VQGYRIWIGLPSHGETACLSFWRLFMQSTPDRRSGIRGEGGARHNAVAFSSLAAARSVYGRDEHICDNDPDEFGNGDPTIVSQCWLYEVDMDDAEHAINLVRLGLGRCLSIIY
jgi:hypothetical protein